MAEWWLFYVALILVMAQADAHRRALRSVEAKLAEVLRRLGGDPAAVEAALRRADESADRDNRQLVYRSFPLALLLLVVGVALGAVIGWQVRGEDAAYAGGAFGGLIGYALGNFLHGLAEGLRR